MLSIERQAVFEASFAAEQSRLMKRACKYLCNVQDAEDIVSRTALKAWRAWPKYADDNFTGWIHRILFNEVVTFTRERARRIPCGVDPSEMRSAVTPATQIHTLEYRDIVRAVAILPPHQAHALQRVAVDGATYREAAKERGVTGETIRANLSRARKALHELTA